MSSTPADQSEAFTAFLPSMDDRLSSFVAHGLPETVAVGDDERTFVKDLTPASLPWVEAYAVSRLPSPALASAPANQRLAEDLMRYVGETFIRTLGGSWQHDPDGPDHGMPFVRVPIPASGADADPSADAEAGAGAVAEASAAAEAGAVAEAGGASDARGASDAATAETTDEPAPTTDQSAPTTDVSVQTTDVSVLGLLMTALQRRTGDVFVSVLLQMADAESDASADG